MKPPQTQELPGRTCQPFLCVCAYMHACGAFVICVCVSRRQQCPLGSPTFQSRPPRPPTLCEPLHLLHPRRRRPLPLRCLPHPRCSPLFRRCRPRLCVPSRLRNCLLMLQRELCQPPVLVQRPACDYIAAASAVYAEALGKVSTTGNTWQRLEPIGRRIYDQSR